MLWWSTPGNWSKDTYFHLLILGKGTETGLEYSVLDLFQALINSRFFCNWQVRLALTVEKLPDCKLNVVSSRQPSRKKNQYSSHLQEV
jgi:hypothetical protein